MNSVLNLPLPSRCENIQHLVSVCTNKELENFFPLLIDDIFGISNHVGWKLRQCKFSTNPYDYEILCRFFHPSGPVYKLCYKLLVDCHLKYDFPLSFLPIKVQKMIADGVCPPFYADKLQVDHKTRTPLGLALNPFELFMFHFVYHLVNPNIAVANDAMVWDFLYMRLVEDCLIAFLPTKGSTVEPPAHYFVVQSPPRPHNTHFPASRPAKSPTLLKPSVIMNQSSSVQHNSFHTSKQVSPSLELWRSELVAQLCFDFWLSTSSFDPQSLYNTPPTIQLPFWAQSQFDHMSCQNFAGPIWSQQYLPSGEQIRVVRFLVKHVHYFANSLVEDSSAMDELKRMIIPSCHGKLYHFLRYTMQHWPLDTSFRLILETWLSYIQPWRYQDSSGCLVRESDDRTQGIEPRWMSFIAENLLVYSFIFQQLLIRFSRMDLSTPKNAYMLFRVTKVFSLPNLMDYLRNIEGVLEEGSNKPVCSKWAGLVRQHIIDLEGPSFQYRPLFGPGTKQEVANFVNQIKTALITAQSRIESETRNQNVGFFRWFFFSSYISEYSLEDRNKAVCNLSTAINSLTNMFQLERCDIQNNVSMNSHSMYSEDSNYSYSCGKLNVTGLCLPKRIEDIKYEGDPDLISVRTYENGFLVRILYQVSLWVNSNYANEIKLLYIRDDWIGGIARQILRAPQEIRTYAPRGSMDYSPRVTSYLPPRLSLRILAQYRLFYLLFFSYMYCYFFGYPFLVVVLFGLFTLFFLLWCKYIIGWAPSPTLCPINER